MTTLPTPAPGQSHTLDTLPPEDRAYALRIKRALRCGVPGCSCAEGLKVHCPSHDNAAVPTLTVTYDSDRGFDFQCTRCSYGKVLDALAKRGLMPQSHLYTAVGAAEAGLQPLDFLIQQPQDWLWPNRIPLGKLTLIAGYPSSGKTSIALDIAARVSRGALAPDQPDAPFPAAPVVLALLNGNPKADVLPTLRLFGADLGRIYLADLLSPTHPIDYHPDDPPPEDGPDYEDDDDDLDDDDDFDDEDAPRRRPFGIRLPDPRWPGPKPNAASDTTAPWPGLNHVMKRLANLIDAGSAALLVVDQVEDLASMHRAHVTTVLGMLKALAARSGAAVIALTHNRAPNFPRAVTAMQHRLAQASVVFTTALVEPGERRFLVPLRPPMSDDAPAIPFVLPPSPSLLRRQEPRISPLPRGEVAARSAAGEGFTVAWRKPVFPAHLKALAEHRPNDGAKVRAEGAQAFLMRALGDGPRPAVAVEREAALLGLSKSALHRARTVCGVCSTRVSTPGLPSGNGAWYWSLPRHTLQQDETPTPPAESVDR